MDASDTDRGSEVWDGAVEQLVVDGFAVLPEVCGDDTIERLLEVSERSVTEAKQALGARDIGIGSAEGYAEIVQRSPGRWDVPIDAERFGLNDRDMPWWPIVSSLLGEDAELWSCGVVSSEPGSSDQHWHADSPHERAEHTPANAISALVALQDIPMVMGPTEFAQGSHRLTNHLRNPTLIVDELVYQHAGTTPDTLVRGTAHAPPERCSQPLPSGSCVLFDDRVLHRGMANRSDQTRHLAYVTYRRPGYTTNTYFESERSVFDG